MKYLSASSNLSRETDIKHCALWSSLSLVAAKDSQDQREHVHGGVRVQDAGALQVCGGEDEQQEGEQAESIYLPLGTDIDNNEVSVSVYGNNVSATVSGEDIVSVVTGEQSEHGGNIDIDNVSVSVSEKDNVSIKDNVSATVSGEDIVSVITG